MRALHLLKNAPTARAEYAFTLDNLSSLYLIYGRLDDAESTRKQAIKVRQKLGNPSEYGETEVHLADIVIRRRQYKKAERLALKGLRTMESSSNPPQGRDPLRVDHSHVCTVLTRAVRGRTDQRKASACVRKQKLRIRIGGQRVRAGDARVCRVEERGAPRWGERYAAGYPDTADKAVHYRSSRGRGHVAIPVLLNGGAPAGRGASDSRTGNKDNPQGRSVLSGVRRKRLLLIEYLAIADRATFLATPIVHGCTGKRLAVPCNRYTTPETSWSSPSCRTSPANRR